MFHYKWGADSVTLLRLCRSIIRSKLDCASVMYNNSKENIFRLLDPVHNEALRMCTGAFKSSPIVCLYAESREVPLTLRLTLLSLHFLCTLKQCPLTLLILAFMLKRWQMHPLLHLQGMCIQH